MKRLLTVLAIAFTGLSNGAASYGEEKAPQGHCEKKEKDGSIKDIEAKDKAECKQKGGRWEKAHGHDEHKEGDGHKHKE